MGYRPKHPSPDTLTIDFNKDDPESYSKYLENLKDFLKSRFRQQFATRDFFLKTLFFIGYEMKNDNLATCDYGFDSTEGKLCRFPISEHIPTECSNENSYGFANGNPCIFLKLNKVNIKCLVSCTMLNLNGFCLCTDFRLDTRKLYNR